MKTLQREFALSPVPECEALIEEARRRQRRRRWAIGLVAAAVLATVIGFALSGGPANRGQRPNSPGTSAPPTSGEVLRGSDTSLVVWPATQCCDPVNTVYVDNLDTGKVVLRRFPAMAGGDFPYVLEPVGRWLVYNGAADDPGVSAIFSDLTGSPRVLGNATFFVPSAVSDQIWLVDRAPSTFGGSVRSVSVSTDRLGPVIQLPKDAGLVEGTVRGLLLVSKDNDLELWRPGSAPSRFAHMSGGVDVLFAANARVVAYGTGCRNEEANSIGYSLCTGLRTIDLRTGTRRWFPAPSGTLGWEPNVFASHDALSPGDAMLAAFARIAPARAAEGRLFVLPLGKPSASPLAVSSLTPASGSLTAWSIAGSWLLYQGSGARLRAFQVTTRSSLPLNVHIGQNGVMALVTIPNQPH